jgi:hypothetical protein
MNVLYLSHPQRVAEIDEWTLRPISLPMPFSNRQPWFTRQPRHGKLEEGAVDLSC